MIAVIIISIFLIGLYLVNIMLLAIGSASFSLFLDACMGERMIFRRYYLWLERLGRKNKYFAYWLKPFGLCVYCMSEWVFIVLFLVMATNIEYKTHELILFFCVGSGINYLIVDYWINKVHGNC